jgi:D-glycero-alpha-D-manno-heptose-7-phosphate kinase
LSGVPSITAVDHDGGVEHPAGFVVTAPVRVADVGGWTDTWFAGTGRVCSVAVRPGARVTVQPGGNDLVIDVALTAERFTLEPLTTERGGRAPDSLGADPDGTALAERHPVLAAALATIPPPGGITIEVAADVPAGSGLGTSASVTVALLAALARVRGIEWSPAELAAMAHGVERRVGLESGVQDQWAAAHGGVLDLSVDYPGARHQSVATSMATRAALDARLVTVYLGRPHSSSAVHEQVIAGLAAHDPTNLLHRLRDLAGRAVDALVLGDLGAYGAALTSAHETVRSLHPALVSADADRVTALAAALGALGWKANGAAGDGGSVTVVGPADPSAGAALRAALSALEGASVIDHRLSENGVVIEGVAIETDEFRAD